MAKLLITLGAALMILGVILYFWPNSFSWFGRLPGDIRIEGENSGFYFPITTMLIISMILSVIIHLLNRF